MDIFVRNPIGCERLWEQAVIAPSGNVACRIAGLKDLIAMKTLAGRPHDIRDIEHLRRDETLEANAVSNV